MLTKRNMIQKTAKRTQNRNKASSGLYCVRQRAYISKDLKFNNLLHHITPDLLEYSFYQLKKEAVAGIDGVRWEDYHSQLPEAINQLHYKIQQGSYRARPVKRSYINKEDGRQRPLGITALEDKIVQYAVTIVLQQIYEVDFKGFSYGFRPNRNQHDALDALSVGINRKCIRWILDADIQGFFDNIDHDWLLKFIEHRVVDKRILRLIRKWLKTGWIENGKRYYQEKGTPQGSVISPLLGNIFLHYVLDLWIDWWRQNELNGDVIIVRYADDFIIGFQYYIDANRCLKALKERMRKFGLNLHPDKTKLIEFGKYADRNRQEKQKGKPETFNFLGFTHICTRSKNGIYFLKRITLKNRFRTKCREIRMELKRRMHDNLNKTGMWLRGVILGFQNYYAVPGNLMIVKEFYTECVKMWLKVIRRRSQKGRKWTWDRFIKVVNKFIPRVRTVHPFPEKRFDAKYLR